MRGDMDIIIIPANKAVDDLFTDRNSGEDDVRPFGDIKGPVCPFCHLKSINRVGSALQPLNLIQAGLFFEIFEDVSDHLRNTCVVNFLLPIHSNGLPYNSKSSNSFLAASPPA